MIERNIPDQTPEDIVSFDTDQDLKESNLPKIKDSSEDREPNQGVDLRNLVGRIANGVGSICDNGLGKVFGRDEGPSRFTKNDENALRAEKGKIEKDLDNLEKKEEIIRLKYERATTESGKNRQVAAFQQLKKDRKRLNRRLQIFNNNLDIVGENVSQQEEQEAAQNTMRDVSPVDLGIQKEITREAIQEHNDQVTLMQDGSEDVEPVSDIEGFEQARNELEASSKKDSSQENISIEEHLEQLEEEPKSETGEAKETS